MVTVYFIAGLFPFLLSALGFIPVLMLDLVCGNLFCFSISPNSKVFYSQKKTVRFFQGKKYLSCLGSLILRQIICD